MAQSGKEYPKEEVDGNPIPRKKKSFSFRSLLCGLGGKASKKTPLTLANATVKLSTTYDKRVTILFNEDDQLFTASNCLLVEPIEPKEPNDEAQTGDTTTIPTSEEHYEVTIKCSICKAKETMGKLQESKKTKTITSIPKRKLRAKKAIHHHICTSSIIFRGRFIGATWVYRIQSRLSSYRCNRVTKIFKCSMSSNNTAL